jgi:hypothetical protein
MTERPEWIPHPALDFSLYGLAEWIDAKWVSFFEGESGKPVSSVLLAHANSRVLIVVKTAPKERWDRCSGRDVPSDPVDFAASLLATVADCARATLPASDRGQYNQGIWPYALEQAAGWSSWDHADWTIDGRPVDAIVKRFAHGWAGFTVSDPLHYIGIHAYRSDSTEVALKKVSGEAYGFDFSAPFGITQLHGVAPDLDLLAITRATTLDSDHQQVLSSQAPPNSFPIGR